MLLFWNHRLVGTPKIGVAMACPKQVWDSSALAGDTPGTPTKSMDPLNWSMGEFITLLISANSNSIADLPSLSFSRYVTNAYQPHIGKVIDYDTSQLYQGRP